MSVVDTAANLAVYSKQPRRGACCAPSPDRIEEIYALLVTYQALRTAIAGVTSTVPGTESDPTPTPTPTAPTSPSPSRPPATR